MKTIKALIRRNVKLFFNDKGMFFTSLITPLILILLFVTFLGQIYKNSFSSVTAEFGLPESLGNGFVHGWLFSSLLAVCTVTVSFCSNLLMVQDKVNGSRNDFDVSPVPNTYLALAYFIASAISTLIICLTAIAVCFLILAFTGWYLSAADVILTVLDTVLLVLFGTALSSIIGAFLTTQGQMSAVGTIISSMYGFICGAYMPISEFSPAIRNFISFLPGTYGTSLLHHHLMRGVYSELGKYDIPTEVISELKKAFDSEMFFFGNAVSEGIKFTVVVSSVLILGIVYVLICRRRRNS